MAGETRARPHRRVRSDLLARLLPPPVVTRETTGELWATRRFPVEEAAVARAVESRRREFATTRICARRALAELGVVDVPIPRGRAGSPVWPARVVGSLTHCAGFRAAAVARQHDVRSIGIDAEPRSELPPGVLELVADQAEQDHLAALREFDPDLPWDRLLFSAKESVYKAYFPLTGRWLDFTDVALVLDPGGSFAARLHDRQQLRTDGLETFTGSWAVQAGFLATALVVPAPAAGDPP